MARGRARGARRRGSRSGIVSRPTLCADPRRGTPAVARRGRPSASGRPAHDVAAFVDVVAGELGDGGALVPLRPHLERRGRHRAVAVVQEAGALDARRARPRVRGRRRTRARGAPATRLTVGRTHGIHAEPTTFGLSSPLGLAGRPRPRAAARARDGDRGRQALGRGRARTRRRSRGRADRVRAARPRAGAGPTQVLPARPPRRAAVHVRARRVDARAVRDRDPPPRSAPRCARSRSRSAPAQKGSTAMPHKRNPVKAERICGLARVLRGNRSRGLENVALWHERDISHSSVERIILPDSFLALDYVLDRFAWLVEGLVVRSRADAREPRRVLRPRVQPAGAARAGRVRARARRRLPDRAAQRDARLGGGARFRDSSRDDPERRRTRVDLDARASTSTRTSRTSTSCSSGSRALTTRRRRPSMPETARTSAAARSASSTRSTTTGC